MKYYYGLKTDEKYYCDNFEFCASDIAEQYVFDDYMIMIEMKSNSKEEIYCKELEFFIIPVEDCGKNNCAHYFPRNQINGICKYHSFGLIETGRKWKVFPNGSYKKISSRHNK